MKAEEIAGLDVVDNNNSLGKIILLKEIALQLAKINENLEAVISYGNINVRR